MQIRTILVPVDFSTCSMLVAQEAASLARPLGATITLLHVGERPEGLSAATLLRPDGQEVSVDRYLTDSGNQLLAPYLAAVTRAGVVAESLVRNGEVVETIHDVAKELGADLVMMGTHGRTGLARAMIGSVAERVARTSDVPVMLIRRQRRPECAHASCNWCTDSARSPAEEHLLAEMDG